MLKPESLKFLTALFDHPNFKRFKTFKFEQRKSGLKMKSEGRFYFIAANVFEDTKTETLVKRAFEYLLNHTPSNEQE